MAFLFGVSWLCTLFLWGCMCFPPHKGYSTAFSLSDEEFSSNDGMLGPQTSNQLNFGASLNVNQDSVGPEDDLQGMRHQSFVSPENNEAAGSGISFSEEMIQSKPDSDNNVPTALPVQEYEHEGSEHQHPLGLLLKEHTEEMSAEGVSFPTIRSFKSFIERMKNSFLIPGTDLDTHFQIVQEMKENEMTLNADNFEGEPDLSYRSTSAQVGVAHDDISENEVWSRPINTMFEQSAEDPYQMPSDSLSVPDPNDYTASLVSTSVYDNKVSGLDSAYPHHILAPTEHVSSNSESFDSGGLSGKSSDIFTSGPHVRIEDQSTSSKPPEQIPSTSFFGEDWSFNRHVTASPVNVLSNGQSQGFSEYSSKTWNKTPLTPEKNIQQTIYTSQSKDLTGDEKQSGGFEPGKDFQTEELSRLTLANVLSAPKPPSLNPSHLPVSTGSVSTGSNNPSVQSSSGHVGVQTSNPHDVQSQAYNTNPPDSFHLMSTVKLPSSLYGSSMHYPSTQTAYEEKSDFFKYNLVSANHGPEQLADNSHVLLSSGLDSSQSGVSSRFRDSDADFNSLSYLAPTSASERLFSKLAGNEFVSKNFGIKNIIPDMHDAGKPLGSFSTPLRRGLSLKSDIMRSTTAGRLKTIMQANKVWKYPAFVNKKFSHMAYWPHKPLSASKVFSSTLSGTFWRNSGYTKRLDMSQPFVKVYAVQSRRGYVRGKEP